MQEHKKTFERTTFSFELGASKRTMNFTYTEDGKPEFVVINIENKEDQTMNYTYDDEGNLAQIETFKELIKHLEQFNENIDIQELYKRPFEYSIELTAANYQSSYKGAKIERVFELIGFSVSKLEEYTRVIENRVGD